MADMSSVGCEYRYLLGHWRRARGRPCGAGRRALSGYLATGQAKLLQRLVAHALAHPTRYSVEHAHVPALTRLAPWLKKQVKTAPAALCHWIAACREQLEALDGQPTARAHRLPSRRIHQVHVRRLW